MITVDSRGCGTGKTTNHINGIYSLLHKHKINNERALIVVPSIELMKQYKKSFNDIVIINSDNVDNTTAVLLNEFRNGTQFIIITSETFVKINNFGYVNNYHLIFDEALENIFKITKINTKENEEWKPDLRLYELFVPYDSYNSELLDLIPENDTVTYIKIKRNLDNKFIFDDSNVFRNLTHVNYNLYVTRKNWEILNSTETTHFDVFISELNPEILTHKWLSIHIAASHFESTFMSYWMKKYNINYKIVYPFEIHRKNMKLHCSNIDWSKNKKNTYREIYEKYVNYVNTHVSHSILCVRNNDETNIKLNNEIRITHNVHGMNNYSNIHNVSLESALVPDNSFFNFIINHYGITKDEIIKAYSTYKFYQIAMRSSLRNNSNIHVNIFMLDRTNAKLLLDFIMPLDRKSYVDIDITYTPNIRKTKYVTPEEKQLARKEKNKEYQRRHREKKKINGKIGTQ